MRTTLILTLVLGLLSCDRKGSPEAKDFARAIKNADRAVIFHNSTETGRNVTLDIGAETYTAIHQHNGTEDGFQCLCYADYVIIWYAGNDPVCAIGFQPDTSLSWPDGPVLGDIRVRPDPAETLYAQIQTAFEHGQPIDGYKPPIPE